MLSAVFTPMSCEGFGYIAKNLFLFSIFFCFVFQDNKYISQTRDLFVKNYS